jgi:hypothetical protein
LKFSIKISGSDQASFSARVMASSKIARPSSASCLVRESGGCNADGALTATKQKQAALESQVHNAVAQGLCRFFADPILDEFNTNHQAFAAHITDTWMTCHKFMQGIQNVLTDLSSVLQIFSANQFNRLKRSNAGQGITAIGIAMCARFPVPSHSYEQYKPLMVSQRQCLWPL